MCMYIYTCFTMFVKRTAPNHRCTCTYTQTYAPTEKRTHTHGPRHAFPRPLPFPSPEFRVRRPGITVGGWGL